jgi:tetratricopeptide (TPR) repeat protein
MDRQKNGGGVRWLAGSAIALAALAAYHGSFDGAFVLDDASSIVGNPTLRHLGRALLPPPGGLTVSGRPLVNLSLAVNYALGGTRPWGYHAVNLAIHVLAGLVLFGVVRRTLLLKSGRRKAESESPESDGDQNPVLVAFAAALLWTVHPLQTEAVTYIVQRAESLMGLFYLLTLYCFIRYVEIEESVDRRPFPLFAFRLSLFLSCLFGMATKEVMVSAPLVVLLYDRTFVSGSFAAAWRRHGRLHGALAATWLLLGGLVLGTGSRGGTAGIGTGVPWWLYVQTQFKAVTGYLRLAAWPHPLIFDYGTEWSRGAGDVVPYAVLVGLLALGTIWALWRRPALGFLGAWVFLILAPTALVTGTRQTSAEHRMYLPLAAVTVLAAVGLDRLAGRKALPFVLTLAVVLGVVTSRRNEDYRSKLALYRDAVAWRPRNPWTRFDLGVAFREAHAPGEAEQSYREALRLEARFPEAHNNLGDLLLQEGRMAEAIGEFSEALRLRPTYVEARYNLGLALVRAGRGPEAAEEEQQALLLRPDFAEAHCALGEAQAQMGLTGEALAQYAACLQSLPDYAPAHYNLANVLVHLSRLPEAEAQYEAAIQSDPTMAQAHDNLGNILLRENQVVSALAHYEAAARLQPGNPGIHFNLGNALVRLGRGREAASEYEAALRLQPDFPAARSALGRLRAPAAL